MKKTVKLGRTFLLGSAALALTLTACKKKEGCTDPNAENYDAEAEVDNGTCTYPEEEVEDLSTIFSLEVIEQVDGSEDTVVTITDRGEGIGNYTMRSTRTYILNGFVFVNSGQTLTVQPGTVIKGAAGQGENASALIIARGGYANMAGNAANPIIMTSAADNLNGNIPATTRGLWGGLIILGDAPQNTSPSEQAIEGIPTTEPRGIYGGSDATDNSGVFQYISIRHGGTNIGAGNEINGLSLGCVGSGTTIDHIEIIANDDDGIEFYGGTVNVKHLVVAFCEDDAIDYDQGYVGKGQFFFVVYEPSAGDRIGEHDGGTSPEDGTPYATPVFFNGTYIGRGVSTSARTLTFRDNAGGEYHNCIFAGQGRGVDIENLASGEDSYARFVAGDLALAGNIFYDIAVAGTGAASTDLFKISMGSGWASATDSTTELTASAAAFQASFAANNNTVADPGITYMISPAGGLNPVPTGTVSGGAAPTDSWFTNVTYRGAFDPSGTNWAHGWTLLHSSGYLD